MNVAELSKDFKMQIKRISPLNYLTLNGDTLVLTDEELEEFEYGLTNLLHAICVYKRARVKR